MLLSNQLASRLIVRPKEIGHVHGHGHGHGSDDEVAEDRHRERGECSCEGTEANFGAREGQALRHEVHFRSFAAPVKFLAWGSRSGKLPIEDS